MQNGRKTNMKTRQQRPGASFAARSKPWSSNATRPEPGSHNAQRNYQRYLELARAEALTGNTVGAENYYQHAEHYFMSMSSDRGAARADRLARDPVVPSRPRFDQRGSK